MSKIQSVLFDMEKWTPQQARKWLTEHDLKPIKKMHRGRRFLHYRLRESHQFNRLRIKKVGHGIEFIIGFY